MNRQSTDVRLLRTTVPLVLAALFLSGFAAIINESVWQRALKIYLAGCESASSMIIVLVFMLGLGAGSLGMGLIVHRVKNPLRTLALIELALFLVNLTIAAVLAMDISDSIYSFQRLAVSLGVPLRLVYGASAVAVLLLPCVLMGVTMPLVSEVSQRQLRYKASSFLTTLFVLNTLGSVLGGLTGGFLLMPYYGQRTSLVVGASCNCVAAAILSGLYFVAYRGTAAAVESRSPQVRRHGLATEEILGFWLGFFALGYEMYLFRVAALAHQPLPYNFSLVLCYYLLFWSIGVSLAKRIKECCGKLLKLSALSVAMMPLFYVVDRRALHYAFEWLLFGGSPLFISALVYSLPCIFFGCLFGQLLARLAKNWGSDVGRYYGLNTLGSCLGILVMTLLGFEINPTYDALLIALGYFVLAAYSPQSPQLLPPPTNGNWRTRLRWCAAAGVLLLVAASPPFSGRVERDGAIGNLRHVIHDAICGTVASDAAYYGKDGVVEIDASRNMSWDGLWHSKLSANGDHVGSKNWFMAAVPFLCFEGKKIDDALVIGLGTGITVATLAKSDQVDRVDVYEIDHKLLSILQDYPEGTLHVAENPKVHVIWQDGRAGLALNAKQYDIITQQPLYLKQAGSSILLSREYMELVKKRLKPNGIYCVYSNSFGNPGQALLVRKTVSNIFPHYESFGGGYMIVASQEPFIYHAERLAIAGEPDPLVREMRTYGAEKMAKYLDSPRLEWNDCPYIISDNHPLVEYPGVVHSLLKAVPASR
jgi:spermidine synthase